MVHGVIIDTVSIQNYIFSTNNLKENLGASYLVEKEIYGRILKETINSIFEKIDSSLFESWEKEPEKIQIKDGAEFEIGYIGGGNAFLLFKDEAKAKDFIRQWSKRLLVECPGLTPAAAAGKLDLDSDFKAHLSMLFDKLSINKSSFVPQTIIKRHGITSDCRRTGYSREICCEKLPSEEQDYISSVSNAKIEFAQSARKYHNELLGQHLNNFVFTDELEKLGQIKGKDNYIAIVHIDGNDTSNRFREQDSLTKLRNLSITVRKATLSAFKEMLLTLIEKIPLMKDNFNLFSDGQRKILPLRPIIIGGDDITFVSDGRLGIWLAKIFLEAFEKQKVSDGKPLTACAGIAITKTKYPFYRGYKVADDLTKEAKDKRHKSQDNGSWLDFHISSGGFSGHLRDIRQSQYKVSGYDLFMKPYSLKDLEKLIHAVSELKSKDKDGKPKYSHSKIMKLREVLFLGKTAVELFRAELDVKKIKLPEYKDFRENEIIKDSTTPYLDMIELMEFYPDFALNGGNDGKLQN